jgi:hypothetical protein
LFFEDDLAKVLDPVLERLRDPVLTTPVPATGGTMGTAVGGRAGIPTEDETGSEGRAGLVGLFFVLALLLFLVIFTVLTDSTFGAGFLFLKILSILSALTT